MGKAELETRVLQNPRIEIYGCGERDIRGSRIDRRVLATLEFLASSGLRPTVTSLQCGHSTYTASGNVSHHSSGDRKSTRLNSSHANISYAVFCLKKKNSKPASSSC